MAPVWSRSNVNANPDGRILLELMDERVLV